MEGEERKVNWTFSGSYTVEMAYIMAVFCMVMVVLVQQAYRIHDETKSGMKLQEAVEQMRHDEDDQTKEIEKEVFHGKYGYKAESRNFACRGKLQRTAER